MARAPSTPIISQSRRPWARKLESMSLKRPESRRPKRSNRLTSNSPGQINPRHSMPGPFSRRKISSRSGTRSLSSQRLTWPQVTGSWAEISTSTVFHKIRKISLIMVRITTPTKRRSESNSPISYVGQICPHSTLTSLRARPRRAMQAESPRPTRCRLSRTGRPRLIKFSPEFAVSSRTSP